jgi:phenylacetate-CoA ligase
MSGPKKLKDPAPGWPSFPAKPALPGLLDGLKVSQWWPTADLAASQQPQLAWLVNWAATQVPHYESTDWARPAARSLADALAGDPARFSTLWREIPVLTKPALRALGSRLNARTLPPGQTPLGVIRTSGSTGIPVEVRSTAPTRMLWDALTLREHLWWRRDFTKRMGVIRFRKRDARASDGQVKGGWGPPVGLLYRSGPSSAIHIGKPVEQLADWLVSFDPSYLLAYPSIMNPLMDAVASRGGRPPSLEEVRLISEPVDPELQARLATEWQTRCTDLYSANEVGYIAFRCREQGALHVQSESLLVEVLDDAGQPCAPGETGRVVVTSLHNLATPLLRYEIGDLAEAGAPCPCGRGLPVLTRVMGRVRNLVRTPDGRRYWPVGLGRIRTVTPIIQAQFVQTALDTVELRAVCSRALSPEETADAVVKAREALGYPFEVSIVPMDEISRGPTGKFEEFLSLVDPS